MRANILFDLGGGLSWPPLRKRCTTDLRPYSSTWSAGYRESVRYSVGSATSHTFGYPIVKMEC